MADDYIFDGCDGSGDDTDGLSHDQEMPLDEAFLMVFEDLSVNKDTVKVSCIDEYTVSYSVDTKGTLKGVSTPITWTMDLKFEFNADGEVTKITDLTPFHRNLYDIFLDLLLNEGDEGTKEEEEEEKEEKDGKDDDKKDDKKDDDKKDDDKDKGSKSQSISVPMAFQSDPEPMEYQMYTVTIVLVALVALIGVVIGVCTGTWISLNCPKQSRVVQYGKVEYPKCSI